MSSCDFMPPRTRCASGAVIQRSCIVLSLAVQLLETSAALAQPRLRKRAVWPVAADPAAYRAAEQRNSELADLARLAHEASAEMQGSKEQPVRAPKASKANRRKGDAHIRRPMRSTQSPVASNVEAKHLAITHASTDTAKNGGEVLRNWSVSHTVSHAKRLQDLHSGMKNFANATAVPTAPEKRQQLQLQGHHLQDTVSKGADMLKHWSTTHATAQEEAKAIFFKNSEAASASKQTSVSHAVNGHTKPQQQAILDPPRRLRGRLQMPASRAKVHAQQQHEQVHLPSPETVSTGRHVLEHWQETHQMPIQKRVSGPSQNAPVVASTSKPMFLHSIADDLKDLHSTMHQFGSSAAHDAMQRIHSDITEQNYSAGSISELPQSVSRGIHALEQWSEAQRSHHSDLVDRASLQKPPAAVVASTSTPIYFHSVSDDLKDLHSTMHQFESSAAHDAVQRIHGDITEQSSQSQSKSPPLESVSKGIHALEQWSDAQKSHQNERIDGASLQKPLAAVEASTSTHMVLHSVSDDLKDLHSTMHQFESSAAHDAMQRIHGDITEQSFQSQSKSPPLESVSKGIHALEQWSEDQRSHQSEHIDGASLQEPLAAVEASTSKPTSLHPVSDDLKDLHSTMHQLELSARHDAMQKIHSDVTEKSSQSQSKSASAEIVSRGFHALEQWSEAQRSHQGAHSAGASLHKPAGGAAASVETQEAVENHVANAAREQAALKGVPPDDMKQLPVRSLANDFKNLLATERHLRLSDVHTSLHNLDVRAHVVSHDARSVESPSADMVSKGTLALEHWSKAHPQT